MSRSQAITHLLREWRDGNKEAFDDLIQIVYAELHHLAHRYLIREDSGHTLQTTALVNEAWLRLAAQQNSDWQNRAHFFAVAAQVMRHLLVDHARRQQFARRGAGARHLRLDEVAVISPTKSEEIISLHEALDRLAIFDPRKSRIVELRYFGGLSIAETAEVLEISEITVKREWMKAKAWLYQQLNDKPDALLVSNG